MTKSLSSQKIDIQKALEEELARLERVLGINGGLEVLWVPEGPPNLAGEVKGTTILIYEVDADEAIATLRHEIVDYMITKAIHPYKELLNMMIRFFNDKAYRNKEEVVDIIANLLGEG